MGEKGWQDAGDGLRIHMSSECVLSPFYFVAGDANALDSRLCEGLRSVLRGTVAGVPARNVRMSARHLGEAMNGKSKLRAATTAKLEANLV